MKTSSAVMVILLLLVAGPVAFAEDLGGTNIATGGICIRTAPENLSRLDSLFRSEGGYIKGYGESDYCRGQNNLSYSVPFGLEAWAIQRARRIPYVLAATTEGTTAGGSGETKTSLPIGTVFSEPVTPQNLESMRQDFECKIRPELEKRFTDVDLHRCSRPESHIEAGVCILAWLGGNTRLTKRAFLVLPASMRWRCTGMC